MGFNLNESERKRINDLYEKVIITEQSTTLFMNKLNEDILRIKQVMGLLDEAVNLGYTYDAVLIGGLTNKHSLSKQVEMLEMGFNGSVKGFQHYEDKEKIRRFLCDNYEKKGELIPIFLFSAGCKRSMELISMRTDEGRRCIDLKQFYIIEPFASDNNKKIVKDAVSSGVPAYHVFVGSNPSTGEGIVPGAVSSGALGHFKALTEVGKNMR